MSLTKLNPSKVIISAKQELFKGMLFPNEDFSMLIGDALQNLGHAIDTFR